jgi:hypothetical protein
MSGTLSRIISKPFKIMAIIIILIAIALRLGAQVVGAEKYRLQILNHISTITGKVVKIDNNLLLKTVPITNTAKIIISGITLYDNFEGKDIKLIDGGNLILSVSLVDFYLGKIKLKNIEISDSKINIVKSNLNDKNFKNWDFINDKGQFKNYIDQVTSFAIANSSISYVNNDLEKKISDVNLMIELGDVPKISGNVKLEENIKLNVNIDVKNFDKQSIKFVSTFEGEGIKSEFLGDLLADNENFQLKGKFTNNFKKSIFLNKAITNIFPFLKDMLREDFANPVSLNGDLELSSSSFAVSNLVYDSLNTKAQGSISRSAKDNLYNVQLKFSSANLEDILSTNSDMIKNQLRSQNFSEKAQDAKSGYLNFALIDDENVNIDLTFANIKWFTLQIRDFDFHFSTKKGQVNQGNLGFTVENEFHKTDFKLNNFNFTKVDDTHLLLGEFFNQGNNISETFKMLGMEDVFNIKGDKLKYSISSKIIISPKEISFFSIDGKVGDSGSFTGSLASTHDDMNHYNVDLVFADLYLENIVMPTAKDRVQTLLKKSASEEYLSYFRWFRTLDSSYRLKLQFQNTEFNGQKIKSLKFLCKLLPGSMVLESDLDTDFADGNYRIELYATQIKPALNLQVNSLKLDFEKFKQTFLSFIEQEPQPVLQDSQDANSVWDNNSLNIFRLYKYSTKFDLSIINLMLSDSQVSNFRAIGHTSNKVLYFDNLYGETFGGQFQSQGNISFYDQIVHQFSFNAANIDFKQFASVTFPTINAINGKFSATASLVTQGETLRDLFANLNLSAKIASPILNLDGIDVDQVVDVALKRQAIDKTKIFDVISDYLNFGKNDLNDVSGSFTATKGIVSTNDLFFRTRFSNAVLAATIDLNNLTVSSNSAFYFTPYTMKTPISFNVLLSGNLKTGLTKKFDRNMLDQYIKWAYNIVTDEDIAIAKKKIEDQKKMLSQDPDNKDYLFYKLEQQKDSQPSNIKEGNKNETLNNTQLIQQ